MKQIITAKDLGSLYGKFIVQLDSRHDEPCMANKFRQNPGFWLEKRISFVGRLYGLDGRPFIDPKVGVKEELVILNGIHYCHGIFPIDKFLMYWNHYQFGTDKATWEKYRDSRYHRLLTSSELDWMNGVLKQN